jgi:signal transduction histidine kinase
MVLELILIVAGLVIGALLILDLRRRRGMSQSVALPPTTPAAARGGWDDLRALGDTLPVALIAVNGDGRVDLLNATAMQDHPGLAEGMNVRDWSAPVADVLTQGDGVVDTVPIGDPPRTVRVACTRTHDGTVATLQDVTEDVDFEEARRAFSAAVSHELRTPLARILGLAESLALPDLGDEREVLAEQIVHEVEGMRNLIDEMLLLAALDRGRLAVAAGVVDACAVALGVVEDARTRRTGRGRTITLAAEGVVEIPIARRLCEVVIQNLVDNALVHGGATATVAVTVRRVDGDAEISVRDDGVGIDAQHLPFVFQRFYRADPARSGPGSGLGLALVKHIVEAHGGMIDATSCEVGAEFLAD